MWFRRFPGDDDWPKHSSDAGDGYGGDDNDQDDNEEFPLHDLPKHNTTDGESDSNNDEIDHVYNKNDTFPNIH